MSVMAAQKKTVYVAFVLCRQREFYDRKIMKKLCCLEDEEKLIFRY